MTASNPPLRLAIFIDNLDLGGAQKLLLIQIGAMAATHRILIVNFGPETPLAQKLQNAGAEVVSQRLSRLTNITEWLRIRRDLASWKPDIIHSHLLYAAIVASIIAKTLKKPHVTTLHNETSESSRFIDNVKSSIEGYCISKWTSVAIACGPRVAITQRSRLGQTPLVTVQNRVMPVLPQTREARVNARAAANLAPDQIVFLAAGRLVRQKGFDLLIDAFARVAVQEPSAVLLIAGEGEEQQSLELKITKLGLRARLRLLGVLEDLGPTIAIADAFILSSRHEGLPLVLLEALAAGLPIVATRVGDIETVVDGESALLVEASQIDMLSAAIGRIVSDKDLRLRLAEGALKANRAYTDVAAFAAELDAVYTTACDRHAQQR